LWDDFGPLARLERLAGGEQAKTGYARKSPASSPDFSADPMSFAGKRDTFAATRTAAICKSLVIYAALGVGRVILSHSFANPKVL